LQKNLQLDNTLSSYKIILERCKEVFHKKMMDYGASWRILRPASLTDQLFIKAKRIRSLQEKKENKVGEGVVPEFMAIFNYSIMSLIQLETGAAEEPDLDVEQAMELYAQKSTVIRELMVNKNHDYSEAWRDMRISSMTDLILVKLFRIKQIEDNSGKTSISEGIDSNLMDISNYAIFCLILLDEEKETAHLQSGD
jgi:hypothetical protein